MKTIRIGSGAGYGGDRIEPALDLIRSGNLDYIIFECLAERTIALAQQRKMTDPDLGYNEFLEYRFEKMFPILKEQIDAGRTPVKIITNMGAANPSSALRAVRALACAAGLPQLRIAAVVGDDVFGRIGEYSGLTVLETGLPLASIEDKIVSANAYIGASGIVQALEQGADIVITGRVADPALVLGPLIHEFGWAWTTGISWERGPRRDIFWNVVLRFAEDITPIPGIRMYRLRGTRAFPLQRLRKTDRSPSRS